MEAKLRRVGRLVCLVYTALLLGGCSDESVTDVVNEDGSIRGVVAGEAGNTYPGVSVMLQQAEVDIRSATTDTSGSFAFFDVPPGGYYVVVDPPPYTGLAEESAPVTLDVGTKVKVDITVHPVPMQGSRNGVDLHRGNFRVTDASGERAQSPDEPLYRWIRPFQQTPELYPLLDRDGHHITLGEWSRVRGTANVSCDGARGTHVSMELSGLIPGGRYSGWVALVDVDQGAAPVTVANGMLGNIDGTENKLTASASGEGQLDVIVTPGPLSVRGLAAACILTQSDYTVLILTYHLSETLVEDDPKTWVNHLVWDELL